MNEKQSPEQMASRANLAMLDKRLDEIDWRLVERIYALCEFEIPLKDDSRSSVERIREFVRDLAVRQIAHVERTRRGMETASGRWRVHSRFYVDDDDDPQCHVFTCAINFVPTSKGVVCITPKAVDRELEGENMFAAAERYLANHGVSL